MSLTFSAARDEILSVFKTAWDTTGLVAVYDDRPSSVPSSNDSWARPTVSHTLGRQGSLSGALGKQKWNRIGFITIQIFAESAEGLSDADILAKLIVDAYEGTATPGGVWFKNVRVNEVGPDGSWFQVNVIVDFEYDEVK